MIDFLSKATLVGFMAGAAIIVSLQQLKGLLGIVHFTSKMQIVPVLVSVFKERDEVYFDFDVFFNVKKLYIKESNLRIFFKRDGHYIFLHNL